MSAHLPDTTYSFSELAHHARRMGHESEAQRAHEWHVRQGAADSVASGTGEERYFEARRLAGHNVDGPVL